MIRLRMPAALPRLRNRRDRQSLAYLAVLPALAAWQWVHGWRWWLYAPMLLLTLGVGVIHHQHMHRRMWRGRRANRLTDAWITLLQGQPGCVFWPAHRANHHRHRHGPADAARTYRFAGGDSNHLAGYLLHPLQAVWVLLPHIARWMAGLWRHRRGAFTYCAAHYALWLGSWAWLLALDWRRALLFVILPQLHGLHWLLATNYLQHAHADGRAGAPRGPGTLDYARNFEGWVNPLFFNIGLHTAHHEAPRVHWSELPRLHHGHYRARVHPALNEGGLIAYMLRVFLLGAVSARWRSRPLMPTDPS